uniref:Uncharacterized protein n=1 Tax=viral metagenome TaxID=1070528 RepID=A0A6C0LV08_9ZZZZ
MCHCELSYVELYVPERHGELNDMELSLAKHIYSNYLLMHTIDSSKFFLYPDKVNTLVSNAQNIYKQIVDKEPYTHPVVNNFDTIVHQNKHAGLHIIQRVSDGDYTFAVLKTCWLKIFQRRWINVLKRKREIVAKMQTPDAIRHREIHGAYPFSINIYA